MNNETDVASGTETPQTQELKSTDTSVLKQHAEVPKAEEVAEQVATTTEDTEAEADDDSDDTDDAKPADSSKKRNMPRWMKERLARAELTAANRAREATIRELRDLGVIQNPQAATETVEQDAPKLKTLADFDFDQDEFIAYRVEEALKADRERATRETQQKTHQEAQAAFLQRIREFEQREPGALDEIRSAPTPPPHMVAFIQDSGHDIEVALHLARNQDRLHEIANLSPMKMAAAIREIAQQFEAPEKAELPQKKVTKAPEPPRTITGSARTAVDTDSKDVSSADRIRAWREQRSKGLKIR